MEKNSLNQAKELLRQTKALMIHAGAGMSVDSGIPDYRSKTGIIYTHPVLKKLNLSYTRVSDPDFLFQNPRLFWGIKAWQIKLILESTPHTGYNLIKKFAEQLPLKYFVYTSNIDNQFQDAEFNIQRITECHGNALYLQCSRKCTNEIWSLDFEKLEFDEEKIEVNNLPECPKCKELARPNVYLFGDGYWIKEKFRKQSENFYSYINQLKETDTIATILEIGAGKEVSTIRNHTEYYVKHFGYKLIRINTDFPDVPAGEISLQGKAVDALGEIMDFK